MFAKKIFSSRYFLFLGSALCLVFLQVCNHSNHSVAEPTALVLNVLSVELFSELVPSVPYANYYFR